ncbi:hypothetical protein BDZ89DRAFT_1169465 [Hymenopellis radicata]|nr:hypothetical protein BDZ89DRAFT_1169465 [Hymenopellis radicata]
MAMQGVTQMPSNKPATTPTSRQILFDFNAPFLRRNESLSAPLPSAPLHFLDRHLSESLILKRVQSLPSLHLDLYAVLAAYSGPLDALKDEYFDFHTYRSYDAIHDADANSIIEIRLNGIEFAATQIASSLILHPTQPELITILRWNTIFHALKPTIVEGEYASQDIAYRVIMPGPDRYDSLNKKNRRTLHQLRKHTQELMSYMVFCTDGLPLMEDMTRIATMDTFPWRFDSHYAGPSRQQPQPPDAQTTLWTLPEVAGPRRSRRVHPKQTTKTKPHTHDISIVERVGEKAGEYTPSCEDYIQKAWVTAVQLDASAVIFDCGNFVRIGIRHRERQTLFLSNLIDISSCKKPSYGELWTALHIALAYDAVQRLPLLDNTVLGKRKSASDSVPHKSKRRKRDNADVDKLTSHIAKFPVVALFFRFDHFDSPAPLLLFRSESDRRPHYAAKETLRVLADKRLGAGAVGDVYRVTIEPDKLLKQVEYPSFIIKIAGTKKSIRRLRHEEHVYRHLHKAGVSGIPALIGFHENTDVGVCTLMLSDAGSPIADRMDADNRVSLTVDEQDELKTILSGIHDAGVLHRDVRSWNIMVDQLGRLRFIDFDRGSLRASTPDFDKERDRLERFMRGEYIDQERVIGADDLSHSTS